MKSVFVRLQAPLVFDDKIGYWTGEPDSLLLDKALSEVTLPDDVQIIRSGSQVTVTGPREEALATAADLMALGLVKVEP